MHDEHGPNIYRSNTGILTRCRWNMVAKTQCLRFVTALMTLLAVTPSYVPSAQAQQVVTLTGDPWPPFVSGRLGEEATSGIAIDLATEIFGRMDDVTVKFPLVPWKRALREVRDGTKDGILLLLKTEEREQYMAYTDAVVSSSNLIWYSEDRFPQGFQWTDLEELKQYTVGTTRGYSYGAAVDEALAASDQTVIMAPTVAHLFTMLARGRLDLALANDFVGAALAEDAGTKIHAAKRPTGTDVFHIAISKKSDASDLMPELNRIIAQLKKEGFMDKLLNLP